MVYKTIGFQLKLDKAEKLENMFYYIANKRNEKVKDVQREVKGGNYNIETIDIKTIRKEYGRR